jgi:alpha-glucosidase (family GH31 glycosyl hydrolase)
MKKLFQSVFIAGLLFVSADAMAKDKDFSLSFGTSTSKTVRFEVSNAKNISLVIYNDSYGELYSERLENEDSVIKTYNLEDLAEGTYYLISESEQKIEKYKIKISDDNKAEIEKTPFAIISKPEFSISDHVVKLHIANLKNKVRISVTDYSGNTYYSSTKEGENGELNMTFDLDPKTADQYIISIEENGNTFNRTIALR